MITYDKKLQPIFDILISHSIKPIIVGGYVRDSLLNKKSKDIDIELYNLHSFNELETILKSFGSLNNVGKSFGVYKLKFQDIEIDFSLPRKENKISKGHKGFNITLYTNLDFKTASIRRDFTINAIGFDLITKKILDPFHGRKDLKNKVLSVIDNSTFIQDPLRILRAMQFCARFELTTDKNLLQLCTLMIKQNMLEQLPKERIFVEFEKLLQRAKKPSLGIEFLKKIDAFSYFIELKNTPLYFEKISALDRVQTSELSIKLTLLAYDLKQNAIQSFLQKFIQEKKLLKKILLLYQYKNIFVITKTIDDYTLYKIAEIVSIKEILIIHRAMENKKIYESIELRAQKLNILEKKLNPLVEGKDLINLGLTPSPQFSKILKQSYEHQMQGIFTTKEQALKWIKRELIA